jgi:hypothetical protein
MLMLMPSLFIMGRTHRLAAWPMTAPLGAPCDQLVQQRCCLLHRAQDLQRCQARYADAVFILCDKQASSPQEEDTRNIMTLLAIGQALQQVYGQGIVSSKRMRPLRQCIHKIAVSSSSA